MKSSVDGLRIDSVLEVEPDFFPGYQEAAGVYCVGEVDNGNPALDCPYQEVLDGVLNYPMYIPLHIIKIFANSKPATGNSSTPSNPPAAASATSTT